MRQSLNLFFVFQVSMRDQQRIENLLTIHDFRLVNYEGYKSYYDFLRSDEKDSKYTQADEKILRPIFMERNNFERYSFYEELLDSLGAVDEMKLKNAPFLGQMAEQIVTALLDETANPMTTLTQVIDAKLSQ